MNTVLDIKKKLNMEHHVHLLKKVSDDEVFNLKFIRLK